MGAVQLSLGRSGLPQRVRPPAVHAYALHAAYADQLNTDIVAAVPLIGKFDQVRRRLLEIGSPRDLFAEVGGLHRSVKAIGAEQEDIAGEDLVVAGFHAHEQIAAERAAEQMARFGLGGLFGGKDAHADLIVYHGVIAREEGGAAVADQVAARIADMRDGRAIE